MTTEPTPAPDTVALTHDAQDDGSAPTTDGHGAWPALPLEEWQQTKETLHRYVQMVGKIRMELAPFRNHWWHVTLYVGTRGLTTGPMPAVQRTVEVTLDLTDHRLVVQSADGAGGSFPLGPGVSVADFHDGLLALFDELGCRPAIRPVPYQLDSPPFPNDAAHQHYDPQSAERYWRVLQRVERVMSEFAGWFNGKQSPAHLFWHSFDLALGRFSGRVAPPRPQADPVTAEAYSHEVISFGFWAGDDTVPYPAFYSYTAPEPAGLTEQPLRPAEAFWLPSGGMALLPYDAVRGASDPRAALLDFLDSAYEAGGRAAGWDLAALATRADPNRGAAGRGG